MIGGLILMTIGLTLIITNAVYGYAQFPFYFIGAVFLIPGFFKVFKKMKMKMNKK